MQDVVIDSLLGGFILGSISYLSHIYGKSQIHFYKILAFIWTIPFTYFIFLNMASRTNRKSLYDFSTHTLIGTAATFIIALIIIFMYKFGYNELTLVLISLILSIIITIIYFSFEIYKY